MQAVREALQTAWAWCHSPAVLPLWLALSAAVLGAVLILVFPHPATVAHELGHAAAFIVIGKRVTGIKLHTDTSGVTNAQTGRLGHAWGLFWGYPFPTVLGVFLIWAWGNRLSGLGVAVLIAVLGLGLLLARSWFAWLIIPVLLAASIAAAWSQLPWMRGAVCLFVGAAMIFGGARGVYTAWKVWRQKHPGADAAALARSLWIPQIVTLTTWTVIAAAGLLWLPLAMWIQLS